jgi:hypothetical protein
MGMIAGVGIDGRGTRCDISDFVGALMELSCFWGKGRYEISRDWSFVYFYMLLSFRDERGGRVCTTQHTILGFKNAPVHHLSTTIPTSPHRRQYIQSPSFRDPLPSGSGSIHSETFMPLPHWSYTYALGPKVSAEIQSLHLSRPRLSSAIHISPSRVSATSPSRLWYTKVSPSQHPPISYHPSPSPSDSLASQNLNYGFRSTSTHTHLARPRYRCALRQCRESDAAVRKSPAFQSQSYLCPYQPLFLFHSF